MKKLSSNQIRRMWLDYFKSKGHIVEKGASLIPHNDKTLLWVNSGVAALKKYFDGSEIPSAKRITNVQKCIRTNDIESVGFTARHHTFFEMLGNFSIGDYFRESIIPWAYEILTSEEYFALDKEKLFITYHPDDKATFDLWKKVGVKEDHLIPLEGNYWEIGAGPSGPNTEVFYDRGQKYDKDNIGIRLLKDDIENDRYVELWGIVFSQYNAEPGKKRKDYHELPSKNIDTGAGLERIACIMQECETNFETDLFMPLIKAVAKIAKKPYEGEYLVSYRIIVDHIRTCVFALADGAVFSNEGRGYVLRRLLRRAMMHGKKIGIDKPFLFSLVNIVSLIMDDFYPYLKEKELIIEKSIKKEEEKFMQTLNSGEQVFEKMIEEKKELSGKDVFKLYDTYGFPKELTKELCDNKSIKIDLKGFDDEMNAQKERARLARGNLNSMNAQSKDLMEFKEDSLFDYDKDYLKAKVIGLFKDGEKVSLINENGEVILDKTVFYAESGGQVADSGEIYNKDFYSRVTNVLKAPNKQHLHHIEIQYGELRIGDVVELRIDDQKRQLIERNHSATHLLQKALDEVLGDDIRQLGSYVSDEYLRFDFSYPQKVNDESLQLVERKVNEYIASRINEETKILSKEEALKLGAKAFFDDKYGDLVRVVCFGDVSKEFCGGTHVKNSQDIGIFMIRSEESIASGVRRIEGVTSIGAYKLIKEREKILMDVQRNVGAKSYAEINNKSRSLLNEINALKKTNIDSLSRLAELTSLNLAKQFIKNSKGYDVLISYLNNSQKEAIMSVIDNLKTIKKDYLIVLLGNDKDNIPVAVALGDKPLKDGLKAGNIVKEISGVMSGSGGGRPDFAFGAGKDFAKISNAIDLAKKLFL